jgi:acylglycerol lipase
MRRWSEDKLTLKYTRVDAVHGLVDLMDAAVAALPACCATYPVLVLIGGRDQVVPVPVARRVLRSAGPPARIGFYAKGFHLLLRDLNRDAVAADVLAWLGDPAAPLPSGADLAAAAWLAGNAG